MSDTDQKSIPGAESVIRVRLYRAVGRVDGKIQYRVQVAAQTQGEAFLCVTTWKPDVDWSIFKSKSTGQDILGWRYCG